MKDVSFLFFIGSPDSATNIINYWFEDEFTKYFAPVEPVYTAKVRRKHLAQPLMFPAEFGFLAVKWYIILWRVSFVGLGGVYEISPPTGYNHGNRTSKEHIVVNVESRFPSPLFFRAGN